MLDTLNHLQDVLSGYNVKLENYLDLPAIEQHEIQQHKDAGEIRVSYVIHLYDDGMDVDENGDPCFDDWPCWFPYSFHATRESLEAALTRLKESGVKDHNIQIGENEWIDACDIKITPIV